MEILKNLGFIRSNSGPCLYVKKSLKGIVYVALYIDDNLMEGDIKAIDNAISTVHGWVAGLFVPQNNYF